MRLIASEGQHKAGIELLIDVLRGDVPPSGAGTAAMIKFGEERWLLDSVPYQLPGGLGVELLTSDPPDAELLERIRLPYRRVLAFFDQITIDALTRPDLDAYLVVDSATAVVDPSRRGIVGVVLAADGDGRLEPWVQWLLSEYVVDRGWSVSPAVGMWEHSDLAGAIANLAAICTWGDWRPPPPAPPQIEGHEGSRTWRRSLQRSAARKALAHGAITGVHVLDVGPTNGSPDEDSLPTGGASGRQVRTHWRAGHWQNYRLATRDANGAIIGSTRGERDVDWHYEGRWVRPTLVAAKQAVQTPTTVYVVRPGAKQLER